MIAQVLSTCRREHVWLLSVTLLAACLQSVPAGATDLYGH